MKPNSSELDEHSVPVIIKCVPPEDPVLGLRRPKRLEQHGQDKHLRGSLDHARDRLFDSAPPSAVSRDRPVTRSAQDDDFVGVLKRNIQNKLALMGCCHGLACTNEKSRRDD
jgi:hypothetical protein